MNKDDAKLILQPQRDLANARVLDLESNPQGLFQRETFDLSTARTEADPIKIKYGFKCAYVELATDTSTIVKMKPATRISNASFLQLGRKDVIEFDQRINGANLYWDAQANKSITIVFIFDASFKSGSQISQNSGGVSISEGSSVDAMARTTLVATTAALIAPANPDRKLGILENATGADLYIGGTSAVTNSGATRGLKIAPGGFIEWRNTAGLYGYSVAGGDVHLMDQE